MTTVPPRKRAVDGALELARAARRKPTDGGKRPSPFPRRRARIIPEQLVLLDEDDPLGFFLRPGPR